MITLQTQNQIGVVANSINASTIRPYSLTPLSLEEILTGSLTMSNPSGGAITGSLTLQYTDQQKTDTPLAIGYVDGGTQLFSGIIPMFLYDPTNGLASSIKLILGLQSCTINIVSELVSFKGLTINCTVYLFSNKRLI